MPRLSSKHLLTLTFIVCFFVFQAAYSIGKYESYNHDLSHAVANISTQVSGDLDKLPIPNTVFQSTGRPWEVNNYIKKINEHLSLKGFPVSIKQISTDKVSDNAESLEVKALQENEQTIWLVLERKHFPMIELFSIYPLIAASLMTWMLLLYKQTFRKPKPIEEPVEEVIKSWLQVDLKSKKLTNLASDANTDLANKPLCFFCALIDYCTQHPDAHINPNKELPDELVKLANKYFFRLIDLGHTIRKRPNFTNNLEKTLSEIRAALDEIFDKDFEKKELFYPPKAIGEGSRSKAHSFALKKLDLERLEFVGK
jgi:hypothetical protein